MVTSRKIDSQVTNFENLNQQLPSFQTVYLFVVLFI